MGSKTRVFIALLSACCILLAQTSTSAITGTVTDTTGAVIPNAAVTLTNDATGVSATQQTNQAGVYSFPSLPIGQYSVKVEMKGFKTVRKTGNTLSIGAPIDIPVTLEIGETAEVVTVG